MAIQREGYFNGCKPMGLLRIHLFALKTRFLGPDVSSSGLSWRQKMEWVGWSRIWGERRERVRGSPDFWPGVADRRPKTAPAVRRSKTSGVCWVASTADRRSLQWPLIKSVLTVGARRQGQGGGGGSRAASETRPNHSPDFKIALDRKESKTAFLEISGLATLKSPAGYIHPIFPINQKHIQH